ncbi:hypothetical protein [Rahnella victoriana]|jgi:hypothetical protein|uniref:Uncharacterized protein n=1 Tax=Rahnella victoriana TaxID=1510570 RepID=A0ABS0DR72_9GAMM|nr:hypothetical protein [Rahnella victoriana]MBF7956130.1 hypothetical protein [Rahnella victoriana]
MIEYEIKADLELLTGLNAYPLLLPDAEQEGITYQKVSDPLFETGMVKTALVQARFQISFYIINDYPRLLELDKKVRDAWEIIEHGHIGAWPVQTVTRGGIQQNQQTLTNNSVQFQLVRDFIICYPEDAS